MRWTSVSWRGLALLMAALCLGAGPAGTESVRVALGGDLIFGRWVDGQWVSVGEQPEDEALQRRLRGADLALVNLETAICADKEARRWAPLFSEQLNRFTAPDEELEWLVDAGVDVAVVANNHALDCGPMSVEMAEEALIDRGIAAAGKWRPGDAKMGRPAVVEVGGQRAIVVAATTHPPASIERAPSGPVTLWRARHGAQILVDGVGELRRQEGQALVVVSLHWGQEFATTPMAWQRELARALIDAGADLVFGHGPHVMQPIEAYSGGAIVYSAGNLRFDMSSALVGEPEVVELEFYRVEPEGRWQLRSSERPAP